MSPTDPLERAQVVIDARWLGRGGPGTATRLVLRGLGAVAPPGRWVLWGDPDRLEAVAWDGADIAAAGGDPGAWYGQRHRGVPAGDVVCFLHQLRPLGVRRPVLQLLHDTIPLRTAPNGAVRAAKRRFLRGVARNSTLILTPSRHSADTVRADLGVGGERLGILAYPVDSELLAAAGAGDRSPADPPYVVCAAGRDAPHKNLARLVDAFTRSEFARRGGLLVLLGSSPAASGSAPGVVHRPLVGDCELRSLLAGAAGLVCPSTEEGFGLPVWEARTLGIPVATSTAGALAEVAGPDAVRFDPLDVAAMAVAIDDVALRGRGAGPVPTGPTMADVGHQFVGYVAATLARARGGGHRG